MKPDYRAVSRVLFVEYHPHRARKRDSIRSVCEKIKRYMLKNNNNDPNNK